MAECQMIQLTDLSPPCVDAIPCADVTHTPIGAYHDGAWNSRRLTVGTWRRDGVPDPRVRKGFHSVS